MPMSCFFLRLQPSLPRKQASGNPGWLLVDQPKATSDIWSTVLYPKNRNVQEVLLLYPVSQPDGHVKQTGLKQ